MNVLPQATTTYDDFTGDDIDASRWVTLVAEGADGQRFVYEDRNTRLRAGGGYLEVTVDPFSRFHDTDPKQNNAKQMYRSVRRFAVPAGGQLRVDVEMAVQTYRQIPYDLLDAFGAMSVFDLETGVVLNFAATNDTVYAVVERLLIPGVTGPDDHFVHRVVLPTPTRPGQAHHYAIVYDATTSEAQWHVDGHCAYWARTPARVSGFHVGMALFSARDLRRYSRAERERGQGATGRWGPWRITAEGQPAGELR
ncbi:DUF6081 family protein [Actinoplanes xinjiangensis]|uniref:Polysaccharide lyase-like protein n=1 Tax=Actinoplanes xinjiangensis TaxID=512350 RepID=A0A316ETK1_9ACTN|nr:DUF6081 family protein [Actinoplanes xinjiangensis]PWK36057.1 hypothetical protein BC793_12438 [Actinoplanes xinjiangensis]GIF42941.1 hypothetical protein Axi01nite_72520 [Actinoplanes xinjiangensis]